MDASGDYAQPPDDLDVLQAELRTYKKLQEKDKAEHDHFEVKTDAEFWNQNLPVYKVWCDVSELTLPKARELREIIESWVMENNCRINSMRVDNTVTGMY